MGRDSRRESGVGGGSKREMKSRDENGGVRRQPGEKRGERMNRSKEGKWKKGNGGKSEQGEGRGRGKRGE